VRACLPPSSSGCCFIHISKGKATNCRTSAGLQCLPAVLSPSFDGKHRIWRAERHADRTGGLAVAGDGVLGSNLGRDTRHHGFSSLAPSKFWGTVRRLFPAAYASRSARISWGRVRRDKLRVAQLFEKGYKAQWCLPTPNPHNLLLTSTLILSSHESLHISKEVLGFEFF
jgi:hypothetical protein